MPLTRARRKGLGGRQRPTSHEAVWLVLKPQKGTARPRVSRERALEQRDRAGSIGAGNAGVQPQGPGQGRGERESHAARTARSGAGPGRQRPPPPPPPPRARGGRGLSLRRWRAGTGAARAGRPPVRPGACARALCLASEGGPPMAAQSGAMAARAGGRAREEAARIGHAVLGVDRGRGDQPGTGRGGAEGRPRRRTLSSEAGGGWAVPVARWLQSSSTGRVKRSGLAGAVLNAEVQP
jgi:hypothetical protein